MATRTFLFVDQVRSTEQLTLLGDHVAQGIRRSLFRLLRRATELHGGQEVDFTGDGLFCAFDGAAEAVDAAVMMQELIASFSSRQPEDRRLEIRIGLNSGEPLVSEGGGYFGTAVVIGARLCAAAAGGQILAAEIVRILVEPQGVRTFDAAGTHTLKGVPDPVAAYAVRWTPEERLTGIPATLQAVLFGNGDATTTARVPPLLGRGAELRVAAEAWSAVEQGSRRLLLITGEQGTGVTRFAAELARTLGAADEPPTVLYGPALGRSSPLSPWTHALADWVTSAPRAELRLAIGPDAAPLSALLPSLRRVLPGLPDAQPDAPPDTAAVADAVDGLLSRWSESEPVVVVLDRLDRADPASLEVLRRVIESPGEARILLVAGMRSSQVGSPAVAAAVSQLPGVVPLTLGPLALPDTRELVTSVSGEALDAVSLRALHNESGGVPARVIQLAAALRERTLTRRASAALGRVAELRSDLRAQRAEIVSVVQELEELRYDDLEDDDGVGESGWSPYKGLAAYEPEDAADFYGREVLVAELVAKLATSRFLAVVGPSGSGKSSVVRAGLIPALARESVPGSDSWIPVIATPARESIADAIDRGRAEAHGQPIALFVDQFEELWTSARTTAASDDAASRAAALDRLVASVEDVDEQTVVIVSMRADYYGRTAEHPALASLMSESQILVPPMTPGELRRAIEAPARRAGLTLEKGLVQAAIMDVGDGVGRLPLLSTAMLETWQRRSGSSLTLAGYAAAGGARRAIATLAENAYGALTTDEQETARRIFLRLADPADDGDDVARAASLKELGDDDATARVLDHLAVRRLVTVSATTVQVAHEAVLREWPRLRGWLDEDREGRRLHHVIASAADDWTRSEHDPGTLLRGVRLTLASDWATLHPAEPTADESAFLRASEDEQQAETRRRRRQLRRLQILSAALVVLLAVAGITLGFGLVQARAAGDRANEATASQLSAQAAALASTNSEVSLLLAVEGYRRDASIDTESGLLTALNGARFRSASITTLPKGVIDTEAAPDGKTLYTLSTGGAVDAFDTGTWKHLRRIATGIASPSSIVVSGSGKELAYSAESGAFVIDTSTGARVVGPVGGAGASPQFTHGDRDLLTTTYPAPGVRVTDLSTGESHTLDIGNGSPVLAVPDPTSDEFVATEVFGGSLRRYRLDGTAIGPATKVDVAAIDGAIFSPNGAMIAVVGLDGDGTVVDASTLRSSASTFHVRGSRAYDAAFDHGSDTLAVASDDGSIEMIDPSTGRSFYRLSGLTGAVTVSVLSDGRVIGVTSADAAAFDLEKVTPLGTTRPPSETSQPVTSLDRDGANALLGGYTSAQRLSAALDGRGDVSSDAKAVGMAVAVSPRHDLLAVFSQHAGAPATLELTPTGGDQATRRLELPDSEDGEPQIVFSPSGGKIAVRSGPGSVTVVDTKTMRPLFRSEEIDPQGGVRAIGWSPDGSTLYAGGQSGVLDFIDPRTGHIVHRVSLSPSFELSGLDLVPGTHLAAVSSESGFVYLIDTRTRRRSGDPLSAGGTQLQAVAASPDGRSIVALSRDGTLRMWDVASRRAIGPALSGHNAQAITMAYLGSTRLISGDLNGRLISWNLAPKSWVRTACRLAGRDLTADEWKQYLPAQPYRKTCSIR